MNNLLVYRTLLIKFAFSSLLIFMHFLYALYSWLIDQTVFKQPDPWQNRSVNGYKKYQLKKLPNHLVVSVCQEEVFYEYLAKLLAWALFLEVPVVSFYHNENGNIPTTILHFELNFYAWYHYVDGIASFVNFLSIIGTRLFFHELNKFLIIF